MSNPLPEIAFVWSESIADAALFRERVQRLLEEAGMMPVWEERLLEDPGLESRKKTITDPALFVNNRLAGNLKTDPDEKILRNLEKYASASAGYGFWVKDISYFLTSLFIAVFPKCPICWMAYASAFSGLGLGRIPYQSWYFYVLILVYIVLLVRLFPSIKDRKVSLGLIATGSLITLVSRLFLDVGFLNVAGLLFAFSGAVSVALPDHFRKTLYFYFRALTVRT
jgi:hypothetical protein